MAMSDVLDGVSGPDLAMCILEPNVGNDLAPLGAETGDVNFLRSWRLALQGQGGQQGRCEGTAADSHGHFRRLHQAEQMLARDR
jgi:hypothetical protein